MSNTLAIFDAGSHPLVRRERHIEAPGAAFVRALFRAPAGTLIQNYVGELGAAFTRHPSYAAGGDMVLSNAERVYGKTPAPTCAYADGVPPTADYSVRAIQRWLSHDAFDGGVAGRVSIVDNTMYLLHWVTRVLNGGPRWELDRIVAGVTTVMDTFATALVDLNRDYAVELRMIGTTIQGLVDSVVRLEVADANIAAAGRAAVRFYNFADSGDAAGLHLTQFVASRISA